MYPASQWRAVNSFHRGQLGPEAPVCEANSGGRCPDAPHVGITPPSLIWAEASWTLIV